MQSGAARVASSRPLAPRRLAQPPAASRQSVVPFGVTQPSGPQPGDKLLPLIRTPFDLLALPGRVALGTLQSLPEVLEKLPADVERLQQLAQDPRPLEDKQAEVLGELEDRVVAYLQRGTSSEGELLGSVAAALPEPLKEALPEPIKEILTPRADAAGSSAAANGSGKPLATWTITSDNEDTVTGGAAGLDEELPPMTPAAIAASQTAAEVMEVNAAVAALKDAMQALQRNTDDSRANMLKLNLREAEEALSRRLEQMAPSHRSVGDATVQTALREAEALLQDVKALPLA